MSAPKQHAPREYRGKPKLRAAYRLGVFEAITGHAELYDGYHAVMAAQGMDLDQARAYLRGAQDEWDHQEAPTQGALENADVIKAEIAVEEPTQ